jgi:hypothetical protein
MSNAKTVCPWLVAFASLAGCSSSSSGNGDQNGPPSDGGGVSMESGTGAADAGSSDGGLIHIDRKGLMDAGTTSPLDYSNPNLWVCRPGTDSNPCYGDHGELDATELLPDGGRQVVKHERAANPKFDCFYVYPTVYLTANGNQTNLSDDTYVLDALMAQGARMSSLCEVYAPLYRQVEFTPGSTGGSADAGPTTGTAPGPEAGAPADAGSSEAGPLSDAGAAGLLGGPAAALALSDVRGAFSYYLAHFNKGRKFVLLGHSQGSGMLMAMMQQDVDTVPAVRSQMISALLLGGGATVAAGQKVGGTFMNIPTCSSPGETGCVVAYSSFDVKSPPGSNTLFGRAGAGLQTDCTEPGALAGNDAGVYTGSYFPVTIANPLLRPTSPTPDAGTPFLIYRDAFQGQCINDGGLSYLQITSLLQSSDPRGIPPYESTSAEGLGFGLHLVDWNLPMDELIGIVTKQAATAVP